MKFRVESLIWSSFHLLSKVLSKHSDSINLGESKLSVMIETKRAKIRRRETFYFALHTRNFMPLFEMVSEKFPTTFKIPL